MKSSRSAGQPDPESPEAVALRRARSFREAMPRLYGDMFAPEEARPALKRGVGRPRTLPSDERRDEKAAGAFRGFLQLLRVVEHDSRSASSVGAVIAAVRAKGQGIDVDTEDPGECWRKLRASHGPLRAVRDFNRWRLSRTKDEELLRSLASAIRERRAEGTSLELLAARMVAEQERRIYGSNGDGRTVLCRLEALDRRQRPERVKGRWEPLRAYRDRGR